MLSKPNQKAIEEEKSIQKKIFKYIDNYDSFLFYAGAGAGKTYALKESLKYILQNYDKELKRKNQKIVCITYTNVAVNEIKRRIGNTDLVLVSTIHERMWDIIKNYKKELVFIHKKTLESEIQELQKEVENDKFFKEYSDKENLKNTILSKQNELKNLQNLKAKEYKEEVKSLIGVAISSSEKFKKLVNYFIKIDKYNNAIEQINSDRINEVKYDMLSNIDRLEKMKFSHDKLLKYAHEMINEYKVLQKILIDKYPYIFIDEFQDTNIYVVKSLKKLFDYAKENNKKFMLGYFGDSYQTIYNVEEEVKESIINEVYLTKIEKKYNRRSCNEVISLINKIRKDNLIQETIYEDADGGKIEIFFGAGGYENIQNYIRDICKSYNINKNNKLHILFITNKLIAQFIGFDSFYDILSKFISYKNLTTQIMSKDTTKLHEVLLYIFHLIKIYDAIKNKKQINEILRKQDLKGLTFNQYKQDIKQLNLNNIQTFVDLFNLFLTNQTAFMQSIKSKYIRVNSLDELTIYFVEKLNVTDENIEYLKKLMNLDINILVKWYEYITSNNNLSGLMYHTYHSTKGEEYDNVLIVMDNDFGRSKNAIKKFFTEPYDSDKNIRNLLYVSFSRAKKNLFVYYIDDNLNNNEKEIIYEFIKGN